MTTDADRVKPLEWQGLEVRTPQGDLYTVRQLSRIVWVTSLNGTDCPGWSPTEALAKARAQAHYDNRAALAPAPQAADALDIAMYIGSEVRRRNRVGADGERGSISSCCEGAAAELVLNSLRACGFSIHRAAAPQEAPADDETYELGKSDGYSQAVQEIDRLTGGDGEYRYCTDKDPEWHTPDPAAMVQRIVGRFAAAPLSASPISPSDPMTIIAGIRQFGLAADGADLRDLEAAVAGLLAAAQEG